MILCKLTKTILNFVISAPLLVVGELHLCQMVAVLLMYVLMSRSRDFNQVQQSSRGGMDSASEGEIHHARKGRVPCDHWLDVLEYHFGHRNRMNGQERRKVVH